MAETALRGNPVNTVGELPAMGTRAPHTTLTRPDMTEMDLGELAGRRVVLNIFPSVGTGTCAASVRRFNELAAELEGTTVVNVSADLPYAQRRFCGSEGIDNALTGSVFRSSFGQDYGVRMVDGEMAGLLARSVVILDADGTVIHSQLVPETTTEPDYDAAMAALG